jgi:osmotically inducible protein OsmC
MKILSTISATTVGGRNGHGETSDNRMKIDFPAKDSAAKTTPEHLSSPSATPPASAARCRPSPAKEEAPCPPDFSVTVKVPLIVGDDGGYSIEAALKSSCPASSKPDAEELVQAAHRLPLLKATRNNIPVKLTVALAHDRRTVPLARGDHQSPRIHRGPAHARPARGRAERRARHPPADDQDLHAEALRDLRSSRPRHHRPSRRHRESAADRHRRGAPGRLRPLAHDVTARRLVSYNLAPALKAAFEQIFAAPLLFRGILAELGATRATMCSGGSITTAPSPRRAASELATAWSSAARAR